MQLAWRETLLGEELSKTDGKLTRKNKKDNNSVC